MRNKNIMRIYVCCYNKQILYFVVIVKNSELKQNFSTIIPCILKTALYA